jgi:hypothetical protein
MVEKKNKPKKERDEALMRIVVGIVSGIILYLWWYAVAVVVLIQFIYTLIAGKRIKELADFSEIWSTQFHSFIRYMSGLTNKRPFPFIDMEKGLGKFEN